MHINPVSNYRSYNIPKQPPVSFKAHYDGFKIAENIGDGIRYSYGHIHNYSCLIRDLGLFQDMPKMLEEKFPNGVKIYDYACSAGYEPVSICLGLNNHLPKNNISKYTPIFARDNNEKIIKKAQEFKLRFEDEEQKRLAQFKNIKKDEFFIEHRKGLDGQKVHECKDVLKNNIKFEYSDLFEDLDNNKLSDEPCVLFIRNAWQFMTENGREELAQKLHEKLQPKSIVVIGYHDVCSGADRKLLSSGFERIDKAYSESEIHKKYPKEAAIFMIHDTSSDIRNLCFEHKG